MARNEIMDRYGYGMMKDGTDYNIYTTILFNPNYTIKDFIGYVKNGEKSFEPYMVFFTGDMSKLSLLGRYDYQVPFYNINGDKLLACLRVFCAGERSPKRNVRDGRSDTRSA